MRRDFEWDHAKAAANVRKHGVSFDDAVAVFNDERAIDERDVDPDEQRFKITGHHRPPSVYLLSSTRNVDVTGSGSSRPGRPRSMKSRGIVRVEWRDGNYVKILPDGTTHLLETGTSDLARLAAMTDADILAAARSDPDNPPLTPAQLKRMRRISPAKHLRWKLGLSQAEFAKRFRIPLGTLRDWEQHRTEPDQAAQAYLKVIAADAGFVERALAS